MALGGTIATPARQYPFDISLNFVQGLAGGAMMNLKWKIQWRVVI
jgi:hypothetical protein